MPILQSVLERFPGIRCVILVADRGLLSLDNMEALSSVTLKSGEPVEFILAVPGRRYDEFAELLQDFHTGPCESAQEEVLGGLKWQDLRLVVAHNPQTARLKTEGRRAKMAELEAQGAAWTSKLDAQDTGVRSRGKKLPDSGAKARLYHEVKDAHLAHIVRVDLKSDLFTYTIDEAALPLAEMMDGKLLLVTNTPAGLTPGQGRAL